jgi:hypothetical protein
MHQPMAVGAERLEVRGLIVFVVVIEVVNVKLAGMFGDKAAPFAIVANMPSVRALRKMVMALFAF